MKRMFTLFMVIIALKAMLPGAANAEEFGFGGSLGDLIYKATITGSGTSGKIAKFTGSSTIGNSIITESSSKIGVNESSPQDVLHVKGAAGDQLALQSSAYAGDYWHIYHNAASANDYGLTFKKGSTSYFVMDNGQFIRRFVCCHW